MTRKCKFELGVRIKRTLKHSYNNHVRNKSQTILRNLKRAKFFYYTYIIYKKCCGL